MVTTDCGNDCVSKVMAANCCGLGRMKSRAITSRVVCSSDNMSLWDDYTLQQSMRVRKVSIDIAEDCNKNAGDEDDREYVSDQNSMVNLSNSYNRAKKILSWTLLSRELVSSFRPDQLNSCPATPESKGSSSPEREERHRHPESQVRGASIGGSYIPRTGISTR